MIVLVEESKNGIFLSTEELQAEWVIVVGVTRNYMVFNHGREVGSALTLDLAYELINKKRTQLVARQKPLEWKPEEIELSDTEQKELLRFLSEGAVCENEGLMWIGGIDYAVEQILKEVDTDIIQQLIADSLNDRLPVHGDYYDHLLATGQGQSTANIELKKKEEPEMYTACAGRTCVSFQPYFGIPMIDNSLHGKI